ARPIGLTRQAPRKRGPSPACGNARCSAPATFATLPVRRALAVPHDPAARANCLTRGKEATIVAGGGGGASNQTPENLGFPIGYTTRITGTVYHCKVPDFRVCKRGPVTSTKDSIAAGLHTESAEVNRVPLC